MILPKWSSHIHSVLIGSMIVIGVLALSLGQLASPAQAESDVTFIIQLNPNTNVAQFSRDYQLTIIDSVEAVSLYKFRGTDSAIYGELGSDPRVLTVGPDAEIMSFQAEQRDFTDNDFEHLQHYLGFGNGDSGSNTGNLNERALIVRRNYSFAESWLTWWQADVHLDRAHYYGSGFGVTVAVLDTGADLDHPAVVNHLVAGYDFVDHDPWPDDVPNGIDEDEDGEIDEGVGHGTHISGVLAQVAPGAQIMPVRVLNSDGIGTLFDIVKGIVYAVDQGAQIINLSLSTDEHYAMLETAIAYAQSHDVIVIAAASGSDTIPHFPAAYFDVIGVGATGKDGYVAAFSETYAELVDVFAPGEFIYGPYYNGDYAWWSGSSMSTPIVAGTAALLIERGACVPTCVTTLLMEKTQPVIPSFSAGRIDAYLATIYAHNSDPQQDVCLLLLDQTALHPNLNSVALVANQHGVSTDWLLNADVATPTSNLWLRWSESFPGDIVLLPGGHLGDAGWFALLPSSRWSLEDFVEGNISENQLANVVDVIPLHNQELVHLLGRTCVAVAHEDEITVDTAANQTDLRIQRYGRLAFTVIGITVPDENTGGSVDDRFYDLRIRIESPRNFASHFSVSSLDLTPDNLELTKVSYRNSNLTVWARSNDGPHASLHLSIASIAHNTSNIPFLLDVPMAYHSKKERYEFTFATDTNLDGRRITISSNRGGVANHTVGEKLTKHSASDSTITLSQQHLFLPLVMR